MENTQFLTNIMFGKSLVLKAELSGSKIYAKNGDEIDDGTVVECLYDSKKNTWIPQRVRFDKQQPNSLYVAKITYELITHPLQSSIITDSFYYNKAIDEVYYNAKAVNLKQMEKYHNFIKP